MSLRARTISSLPLLFGVGALLSGCLDTAPDCTGAACVADMPDAAIAPSRPEPPALDAGVTAQPIVTPLTPLTPAIPATPVPPTPDAPDVPPAPPSQADAGAAPAQPVSGQKVDLLIMVDNSISMSDKQALLGRTASDLVGQLVNPACIDAAGNRQPAPSPESACPAGSGREFLPVHDINVAVITSSLGDVGANVACAGGERDDRAHLLGSLPRGQGHGTNAAGVLEFRPGDDSAALGANLQGLLDSAGQNGCGWEMSLESWYRFIVEPFPYERLERGVCPGGAVGTANCVQPAVDEQGRVLLDTALLEQRAAFLRPDSLLSIVMLSDENDCSLQLSPQSWVVAAIDDARPMFRGSSICDSNPNDACCYSCPLGAPLGCEADPVCNADPAAGTLQNRLAPEADGKNLRCFEQKRRFGFDFLYPTQRYVNALRERELCLEAPDLSVAACPGFTIPNPLFAGGREPDSVFLGGIVGVPWQELASDVSAAGQPLASGVLRFKSPSELDDAGWAAIVGSSTASPPIPPESPFMLESPVARAGITAGNPINGREYVTAVGPEPSVPDDLQYACIFPLAAPRDCSAVDPNAGDACDCLAGDTDRPLCEQTPGQSTAGTTQFFAKAYPGLRQLEVLRGQGDNASVASICARNASDESRSDFGYRPAMAGIVERMLPKLTPPSP